MTAFEAFELFMISHDNDEDSSSFCFFDIRFFNDCNALSPLSGSRFFGDFLFLITRGIHDGGHFKKIDGIVLAASFGLRKGTFQKI